MLGVPIIGPVLTGLGLGLVWGSPDLRESRILLWKQQAAVAVTLSHNNPVLISNHKNTVQTDRFRVVAHSVQPHETCPRSHRNSVRVGTMNQGVTRSTPDTKTRESGPNRRKTTGNRS